MGRTMTTATTDSPPRIAEVRGRALGVTVLTFFALAWVGWGTGGHLPTGPQVIIIVLAALLSVALTTYAWRLTRRLSPDIPSAGGDPARGDSPSRSFGLIVAAEWIGLFVVAAILGATGHAAVIPAVVCAGVGIHLIPLGRLFHLPAYYVTAGALCLIAIATFVIAPATSTAALWTLLPGVGAALILFATGGVLLRQIERLVAPDHSG
jgi:hypothetical protein